MTMLTSLLAACAVLCAGGFAFGQDAKQTPPAAPALPPIPAAWAAIPTGEVVLKKADGSIDAAYRYRLIEPRAVAIADPGARVPLLVFMHGAGERGGDNAAQLTHFAGWCATDELQSKHPCYVLAMQCPKGETWAALDLTAYREKGEMPKQSAEPTRPMRALMQAIDEVMATKAVDPSRVYLTGLSMGGFGTFDLAARRPAMFACAIPICGGGDPTTASAVARIPFYIVHGSDDPVVPVGLSRAMRDAIAGASADAAREDAAKAKPPADGKPRPMPKRMPNPMYREFDKVGHDSWTPAYRFGDDGVIDWMFAQRRPAAGAAANNK